MISNDQTWFKVFENQLQNNNIFMAVIKRDVKSVARKTETQTFTDIRYKLTKCSSQFSHKMALKTLLL